MIDYRKATVPVWTLATSDVRVPSVAGDGPMTAERLGELRGVLAALADVPIATLEAHPLPDKLDRSRGIPLDAASPLAEHLSQLVTQTARNSSTAAKATAAGENLYRIVVPAKFAAQVDQGIICTMGARGVPGGIRGPLVGPNGKIVGGVTFMPVGKAAAGGAVLTVAAPLVLMAVAVGVSAHADQKRQQAIEHITELLEQLHEDKLDDEHSALDGCRDAIDKATAILLDQGKLGISLGLDSAVHAINMALGAADRRLARWQSALDKLPAGEAVEIATLTKSFPGIDEEGGRFRAHLELAALATALKRRVNVLQAVDHAQSNPDNLFESFTRALQRDQQRLDELESGIAGVLMRLSVLELARPGGLRPPVFTPGEVDRLMRATHRIHRLGDEVTAGGRPTDVAIEMVRDRDGSLVVFPAVPA
ncbi:hypothetical protein [Streptomyces cyaneofuscatus]|uniref:ATP-binding protein n=1 Tax=Streptomyces cyaneofuscatus TaxID=66883 RepID=A0ABZ1EQ56_9ACTN|nr:hypothetical protein [Streptomyces cyaneofuscatus]WSB06249.1 hypothetical protein OG849_02900 [Streptomyces cyaneofuscatus]WSD50217.1 hypothetical protein OG857_32495 [Streptomyces cyaneofuscatus]WTA93714.1 hypothetical protein OG323_34150 [Streptomyces cyaneofuscatus]